ncbi:MAG TPA: metal-dependent hydrolase [Aliiroseovarius sp.]|nr:metal-dependent hydrolase [Aliiroseovarius sp.]
MLAKAWPRRSKALTATAMLGAVFPDFDMLWFHLVDQRAFHHHLYWVHFPAFWALVALVALPLLRAFQPRALPYAIVFFAGIFLHLVLDSFTGAIAWAWPWSDHLYALVTVPATQANWVLSFVLHWTFLAEIVIWVAAVVIWRRSGW